MMKALNDPAVQQQLDIWRHYKADNGQSECRCLFKLLEWAILTQLDSVKQPAPSNVGGRPYEGRQVFYDWDHPFYWVSQLFEEMQRTGQNPLIRWPGNEA